MADALTNLFAEVLMVDPDTLSDDSSPKTVAEWDSVAAMSLVTAIEDAFNVTLSTREIVAMRTIGLAQGAQGQGGGRCLTSRDERPTAGPNGARRNRAGAGT
jgi:acyl carrier protein